MEVHLDVVPATNFWLVVLQQVGELRNLNRLNR